MASRSKNKTTFAKMARESRLRERRAEKQARKEARRWEAEHPSDPSDETPEVEDADVDSAGRTDDA